MCVHVCVCASVCVCVHPQCSCVYMCVCMVVSVCVCVHVHFAQISYSHCMQAQRMTIAAVSLSLIPVANTKEERAEKVHQLSPGHVCIYDYIK